jgi:hypothetical protein
MNKVTFQVIKKHKYHSGHEESTVDIFVDDKPLAEFMKVYEMPMAKKEGRPGLAGNYHPIMVSSFSLEQYYLGKKNADWGEENKTCLTNHSSRPLTRLAEFNRYAA